MQHGTRPPNPAAKSFGTNEHFKKELKSARIKSAGVAAVPTFFILTFFIISPPFGKAFLPNFIAFFLVLGVPFTLIYQFVFGLGFGRKLLPKPYKKYGYWQYIPFTNTYSDTERAIDTINTGRGYAPGRGSIAPMESTKIDWDSHHNR